MRRRPKAFSLVCGRQLEFLGPDEVDHRLEKVCAPRQQLPANGWYASPQAVLMLPWLERWATPPDTRLLGASPAAMPMSSVVMRYRGDTSCGMAMIAVVASAFDRLHRMAAAAANSELVLLVG